MCSRKMFVKCHLLLGLIWIICVSSVEGNPIIKIADGYVQGTIGSTFDTKKPFYAFKGIPFAEPPLGNLRFKPPVPKVPWHGVFDATRDGPVCAQDFPQGSEDCLSINVYTPSLEKQNIPVLAVLYGGEFKAGKCTTDDYGPDYFLEKDVIVVSFNYRIGLFGFLSTEDDVVPGNNGFKDQVLALKWIQKNIRAFGGDPDRVTILGGSAGGVVVSYLLHTPLTKGLFSGAIMQSGVSLMPWSLARYPAKFAFDVGKELGINTDNTTVLVEQLRNVSPEDLVHVTNVIQSKTHVKDSASFGPVIEPPHEGAFITEKIHESLVEGKFHAVPCIIGFSSMEFNFDFGWKYRLFIFKEYDINVKNLIPVDLNLNSVDSALQAAKEIKSFYFGSSLAALQYPQFLLYTSEDQFVRPTREFVHQISKKANVYFFRFSYEGHMSTGSGKVVPGASHSEEMPYMWRSAYVSPPRHPDDVLMKDRFITMWTDFIKYGNPTPVSDPLLENKIWLPSSSFGDDNFVYLNIDKNLTINLNPHKESMQFWDELYKKYAVPPLDTY